MPPCPELEQLLPRHLQEPSHHTPATSLALLNSTTSSPATLNMLGSLLLNPLDGIGEIGSSWLP